MLEKFNQGLDHEISELEHYLAPTPILVCEMLRN
jgi:hypothetical protein